MSESAIPITAGEPLRVLLVEDNPTDQELVQRAFRDPEPLTSQVEIEAVSDADAALAALRGGSFAVVLTDYSLPGRTGLDIVRALRETGDETPVVLMTGSGDETLAVAALQQGAADYVVKELGFERALPIVVHRVLETRTRELFHARERRSAVEYTKRLERQIEDQTVALRRALQESEALRRVGRALAAARELKVALDLVARTIAELLRARTAAVVIRHGAELVLVSVSGALKEAPGLKSADLLATLGAGWEVTATAPMREANAEIGFLWVAGPRAQAFASRELELLEALAEMTALSIANVRAHEELRRLRLKDTNARTAEVKRTADGPAPERSAAATTPTRAEPVNLSALVLPPFPAALGRLLSLAESDDATPEAVEETVRLDPALAARAVQLASAPALGRARSASSLHEALMVLGLRGVRNLAFAEFSRRLISRWGLVDQFLWEQALATAVGTQVLLESRQAALADDGYLCGLLHNVGSVALNNAYPERYQRAVERAIASERPLAESEREELGCDSATVTEQLIAGWSLPATVTRSVKQSRQAGTNPALLIGALLCARAAAFRMNLVWRTLLGERAEPSWIARDVQAAATQLALAPAALDDVLLLTVTRCEVLRGLVA